VNELPDDYDPADTKSVAIPKALIPLISGALRDMERDSYWQEDDREAGKQAAYLIQERLLS
jgi:hypothetical protein